MTIQLLAKPTRPQLSSVTSTITVVRDIWPDNRHLLQPLWGKPVCLNGTVEHISCVNKRRFVLIKNVTIAPSNQRRVDQNMRDNIRTDHSWLEIAPDEGVIEPGNAVQCMAVVIKYQRADRSESFGFRLTRAAHPMDIVLSIVQHALADIDDAIASGRSPSYILHGILNYSEKMCRNGIAEEFKYLNCDPPAPQPVDPGPSGMNCVSKEITATIRSWIKTSDRCEFALLQRHLQSLFT